MDCLPCYVAVRFKAIGPPDHHVSGVFIAQAGLRISETTGLLLPVWNLFWLSPYGLLWTLATLLHRLPGRRCCGLLSSNAYVAHFEQVCVRHSASVPVEKKNA